MFRMRFIGLRGEGLVLDANQQGLRRDITVKTHDMPDTAGLKQAGIFFPLPRSEGHSLSRRLGSESTFETGLRTC